MGMVASQITRIMIVYSTIHSGEDQRKHQSSTTLAFVWGIHRWPVNSLHKWPVTQKMFPFDDFSIIIWVNNDSYLSIFSGCMQRSPTLVVTSVTVNTTFNQQLGHSAEAISTSYVQLENKNKQIIIKRKKHILLIKSLIWWFDPNHKYFHPRNCTWICHLQFGHHLIPSRDALIS